jgi:tetratricopeptide (TPR) repeat protein
MTEQVDPVVTGSRRKVSWRIWCLLIVALLAIPVVWYTGIMARRPLERARHEIALNHLDEAERSLEWAERISYRNPQVELLKARVARHRDAAGEMQSHLKRALALGADPQTVERERMLAKAQVGELTAIESDIGLWLAEPNSETDEICDAYANGLAALGRFSDAMQVLAAWQRDYPQDPRSDYRIGRIEEHLERYDQAEASYRKSLEKSADFFPARFSLGRTMLHQRRAAEALEQFQLCWKMSRPEAALVEAAVALKALGRGEEARSLLIEVLAESPQRIDASYRTVEEQPEGFRAAAEYGRLESDAGRFAEALPWLQAALKDNPLDLNVRYSVGVSLRGLGRREEAEIEFEKVRAARERMGAATSLNSRVQSDPMDLEARLELGRLILENESERVGLYWIRSILSIDPDYPSAHKLLADYFARLALRDPKFRSLSAYHRSRAGEIEVGVEQNPLIERQDDK